MRSILTKWATILVSAISFLAIGYGFSFYMPIIGDPFLDMVSSQSDVLARLEEMDAEAKAAHIDMTLWLDMAYPIAYAICFGGLVLRAFPRGGALLAIPAFLGGGFDITENIIQLMALNGETGLIGMKAFLTPAKFALVVAAGFLALVSILVMLVRRFTQKNGEANG